MSVDIYNFSIASRTMNTLSTARPFNKHFWLLVRDYIKY